MNRNGTLVVFSGPSGSGKGTVLGEYLKSHPEAAFSVSASFSIFWNTSPRAATAPSSSPLVAAKP